VISVLVLTELPSPLRACIPSELWKILFESPPLSSVYLNYHDGNEFKHLRLSSCREPQVLPILRLCTPISSAMSLLSWIGHELFMLAVTLLPLYLLVNGFYQLFLSPLSAIPGPWYAAVSDFWLLTHVIRLKQCMTVHDLFEIYGRKFHILVSCQIVYFLQLSSVSHLTKLPFATSTLLKQYIPNTNLTRALFTKISKRTFCLTQFILCLPSLYPETTMIMRMCRVSLSLFFFAHS
jgi:hypothetical protein